MSRAVRVNSCCYVLIDKKYYNFLHGVQYRIVAGTEPNLHIVHIAVILLYAIWNTMSLPIGR
jgi:hypothetical protein